MSGFQASQIASTMRAFAYLQRFFTPSHNIHQCFQLWGNSRHGESVLTLQRKRAWVQAFTRFCPILVLWYTGARHAHSLVVRYERGCKSARGWGFPLYGTSRPARLKAGNVVV